MEADQAARASRHSCGVAGAIAPYWPGGRGGDSSGRRRLQHSPLDINIGQTVRANQVNIGIHVDGRYHILQMGPQPTGHCFEEGTAIHGEGTTQAAITRADDGTWIVEAKAGSIARLFDTHHTNKYAVNRGTYYMSFRYVFQR